MKTIDLTSMGVQEMSALEMQETDGGVIVLVAIATLILLGAASCGNNFNINVGSGTIYNTQSVDSSFNGVSADSTLNGNSLDFTPIQP